MLANREINQHVYFVQSQIARLSEAIIIAHAMMMEGNLQAMDRWITLMGELDLYHGFAAAQILVAADGAAAPRRAGPERRSILPNPALGEAERKFSASQAFEIPRNANGIPEPVSLERLAPPERRPIPPNPARGKVEGKFSASQALEIPRNAEGISDSALLERLAAPERRPIPPNPARGENRGISVAGFAPREADGKRSRPEMAPQRLEKIESAPGNGMGSEASNLQDVVHGCTAGQFAAPYQWRSNPDWSHKKVGQLGSYEGKLFRLASP